MEQFPAFAAAIFGDSLTLEMNLLIGLIILLQIRRMARVPVK